MSPIDLFWTAKKDVTNLVGHLKKDIKDYLIIIREVLILTLSICIALYACISYYSLDDIE